MRKNFIYIATLALVLSSCGSKQYAVKSVQGERILVGTTNHPDASMTKVVEHYKHLLDKEMSILIGQSSSDMPLGRPESLLTNLTSDVMLQLGKQYTNGAAVDMAVMNVNGHRATMPKGDITVGTIFEIYSFDNELAVVRLKGSELTKLFNDYAKLGGAGISSSAKLVITKDGKLVDAKIHGQSVDPNKEYTIVTLDYLADGNDGFDTFKNAQSIYKPGIILRGYMMDYVKQQTKEGKQIVSKLDGRITVQ